MLLTQLAIVFDNRWYSTACYYADEDTIPWEKLGNKNWCQKIMPLFGVRTIPELRSSIEKTWDYEKKNPSQYDLYYSSAKLAIGRCYISGVEEIGQWE